MNTISPILSQRYSKYATKQHSVNFNGIKEKSLTVASEKMGTVIQAPSVDRAVSGIVPKANAKEIQALREAKIQAIKDLESKLPLYPEFIKKGPLNIANPDYYGIKTAIRKLENELLLIK